MKANSQNLANGFSLSEGQYFRKDATVFRILKVRGNHLELQHAVSMQSKFVLASDLLNQYLAGELVACNEDEVERAIGNDQFLEDDQPYVLYEEASLLSDAAKQVGRKNLKYIKQLEMNGFESLRPTALLILEIKRIQKLFGDAKAPTASTLYRKALAIKRSGGSLIAAYPKYAYRGGRHKSRLSLEVQHQIQVCIDDLRRNSNSRIIYSLVTQKVFAALVNKLGNTEAAVMAPSLSTVTREVKKSFSAYEISVRNEGKRVADKKFRHWVPRDKAVAPLEVVEFDDKNTRVFGIDERTGLPAGRIFLTTGVEGFTAVPMGFSISDQPRNTWSAINAFANCVLPKDRRDSAWSEVKGDIPYMGKMGIAVFDNALYNHSQNLEEAVLDIANCIIAWAKPFTPTEKSKVEDFNGRMATTFFPTLAGFLGPKNSKVYISDGIEAANMSVYEFRKQFLAWAYNDYCNTPRAGGMTPKQLWELGMQGRTPNLPSDINRVRFAAMLRKKVRLRPELISFNGLLYQNHRLEVLRKWLGNNAEVQLRYHPERLEQIFVHDPQRDEWFAVPSANPHYTENLTFYQHSLIRKKARELSKGNPSIPTLMKHRQELAVLVSQLRHSKKLKDRKKAKRIEGESGGGLQVAVHEVDVMTELEAQIAEIEAVEIDSSSEDWEFPE